MYPSLVLENQFGEVSNNLVKGGSSQLLAKFVVNSTDSAGFGVTGFVGKGIDNIFMHTSATPDADNPNPIAGYILAKLSKGFSAFQSLYSTVTPPQSGSSLLVASAGLSVGTVYVITITGTTSQAQWEVLGVPAGLTAVLGLAFVAIATSCTGTGAVQVPKTGGTAIVSISPVGNPGVGSLDDGSGGFITLACYKAGGTIAAPALTMNSYTPAGTVAAPVFTGGALGTHTHSIPAGTDGSGGTSGATSAGTPAGTNSAPVFTGSPATLTGTIAAPVLTSVNSLNAPVDGTIIELCFCVIPLVAPLI